MSNAHTVYYAETFKSWAGPKAKLLGAKPTEALLANAHGLGCRPGKQALAIAMAMREHGVTGGEIVIACGAPQLNKMRGLISDSYLKREAAPLRDGHTVYKLAVTPKGLQRIKRTEAAVAKADEAGKADDSKPAKAKTTTAPRKPRTAKAKPADVNTGEPAATGNDMPVSNATAPAEQPQA